MLSFYVEQKKTNMGQVVIFMAMVTYRPKMFILLGNQSNKKKRAFIFI